MRKSILLLILPFLLPALRVAAQQGKPFFPAKDLTTTGVYYYPEHWDEKLWERDIRRIAAMGFEFVHLAEFAWFRMEPEEGQFNFAWLDKVVDLCEKYHLKVLMCTPSATTPAWMRIRYPETFIMNSQYIRGEHGTRGLGSIVDTTYRKYVTRIVTEMAKRYGKRQSVIGWQLDNEPDAKPDFSPASQEAFRQWLKAKYQSVDSLNAAWGTAFWSQWYSSFDQIIIPNVNLVGWWGSNPHAVLDFKRYAADAQAAFLDFQAQLLRSNIAATQFITTNYTAVSPGADPRRTKLLDFATYTAYPNGGSSNIGESGFRLGNSQVILFASEYFKSVGGVSGVMEIQPGPVNWGNYNPLLLPGTVRMWLYHCFAAGGRLASSYRYRQINYSAEQYHGAIMQTDGVTPSQGGVDYIQFMGEIQKLRKYADTAAAMPAPLNARSTAVLWNLENYWTLSQQQQTRQWDTWNYPVKFMQIAKSFGAPVEVVAENADWSKYKFLIVPAYELADEQLVQKWEAYARNGGQLVITCRTAAKNRQGHLWEAGWAAPLTKLIGAAISAYDMLPDHYKGNVLMKGEQYAWNNWSDLLQPAANTTVLAAYDNQFYKGRAAVVQRKLGKGAVTYIGVDTDDARLETDVLREVYTAAGAAPANYPPGIFVYWRDGLYIAVNYSSDTYSMPVHGNAQVLVGTQQISPGGVLVWKE
ncbi:beta-galactosidase [Chitinophaga jiangningensis]|uniref:Beta-galactosidase n=1 Tax=Chitinophaga jiangningensis TaxID=1419482 RepID=A0A1M7J8Q6_9BACT|nr:beta-galactosidase [Chitinophaga jiangningensis]SHM49385.1 beta-galactosidase [Chitinophaga jiangningensis]